MKPKLEATKNYDLFAFNPEQRKLKPAQLKKLNKSMKEFGFLPSKPIRCVRRASNLVVVDGHHRLFVARQLSLSVFYVVEEEQSLEATQTSMIVENLYVEKWTIRDFCELYAVRGLTDYRELMEYDKEGVPITMAASMLYGQGAASSNMAETLMHGRFVIKTRDQVNVLISLFNEFSARNKAFKTRAFISAFSKCMLTDEFDHETFIRRCRANPMMLYKTSDESQMLQVIEEIYNFKSPKKIPLAFKVAENSKARRVFPSINKAAK